MSTFDPATAAAEWLAGSLAAGFAQSAVRHPGRPALEVGGTTYSYGRLWQRAAALAATLKEAVPSSDPPLVAVLADRTATAYQGVLAALLRGHGYVPLSPQSPPARTRMMLQRAGCRALIVDPQGEAMLDALVADFEQSLVILVPDRDDVAPLAAKHPAHRFLGAGDLKTEEAWQPVAVDRDTLAYVMFTSGSTGVPKGVMVTHRNVRHFLSFVIDRYRLSAEDRLSQMFELVFDLSVFDLFAAWQVGACVCVPARSELLTPARFIQEAGISVWFSVPSVGLLMKRLRLLEPGSYPGLRLSLFCGEALTVDLAESWAQAAPNSIVENLYGPTELTLACTYYRWQGAESMAESRHGVVPIGYPFADASVLVVDESLRPVPDGEPGELLVCGPPVTRGYYRDPEKTAAAFVKPPGYEEVFYRTGDRVVRASRTAPLLFLGRLDHQLKIRGQRIELGEVEAALREATGIDAVAAVGWPLTEGGADAIVAFIAARQIDEPGVREHLAARLPGFAIPRRVHCLDELPLNANGKIDRGALVRWCETGGRS